MQKSATKQISMMLINNDNVSNEFFNAYNDASATSLEAGIEILTGPISMTVSQMQSISDSYANYKSVCCGKSETSMLMSMLI